MARIHFLPPTSHTSPITATDRVPSDELHGNPECQWTVGNANTITRREILHRSAQRLKLTEQQSWRGIAQSKGMTYLQRLPEAIPEGQFLVHNSVRPTHPLGRTVSAPGCKCKMSTLNPATVGGPLSWVRTIA